MTDEEFGAELVHRLNKLCEDPHEKLALFKMMKHHVVMHDGVEMDVEHILKRLTGSVAGGFSRVVMVAQDGELKYFHWVKLE